MFVCAPHAFKEGKGIRYPGTGAAVLYELPMWVLGTKPDSWFRAASDLSG